MTCPVCGTEFNVNTKLKNGVYRCPNPNCTAPYITEKREPSNFALAVIFLLIAVVIFFGFAFLNTVKNSYIAPDTTASSSSSAYSEKSGYTPPATFNYDEYLRSRESTATY